MIIYKCDKCLKEINIANEELSTFVSLETTFDKKGQLGKVQREQMFCKECTDKIKEVIKK